MTTSAKAPFNRKAADVVIRSSNNVDFYLFKEILAVASPFFEDMFSLNQPSTEHSPTSTDTTNVQVIPVTEDSKTLDSLFRLCYPVRDPVFTELPVLEAVLEATIKYQFDLVTELIRTTLKTFIQSIPLQVFVIACRLKLEEEAKLAALTWKTRWSNPDVDGVFAHTLAGASYIPEMKTIPSACYLCLLHFVDTTPDPDICFTAEGNPFPSSSPASDSVPLAQPSTSSKGDLEEFASFGDTDAIIRSSDGTEFWVHKLALRFVHGQKLLDQLDPVSDGYDLPVYRVDASEEVLVELLRLCYPAAAFDLQDFVLLRKITAVAIKYEMKKIIQMIRKQMVKVADQRPLELYFLASQHGWKDVAQEAALASSKLPLMEQYVPEMENVSAEVYYLLLEYQHCLTTATQGVISTHAPNASQWKSAGTQPGASISNSIPPMLSSAIVEATVIKIIHDSNRSTKCNRCQRNYFGGNGSLNVNNLLNCSKNLEVQMRAALSTVTLRVADITQPPMSEHV